MIIQVYEEITGSGWIVVAFSQLHKISDVNEMKEWCRRMYGETATRWKDDIEYGEVRFKDNKDLTLFLLKWS